MRQGFASAGRLDEGGAQPPGSPTTGWPGRHPSRTIVAGRAAPGGSARPGHLARGASPAV